MNRVFCPECQRLGLKSKVYILNDVSINPNPMIGNIHRGYYDEEGFYCDATTAIYGKVGTDFQCSNGHKWTVDNTFGGTGNSFSAII